MAVEITYSFIATHHTTNGGKDYWNLEMVRQDSEEHFVDVFNTPIEYRDNAKLFVDVLNKLDWESKHELWEKLKDKINEAFDQLRTIINENNKQTYDV